MTPPPKSAGDGDDESDTNSGDDLIVDAASTTSATASRWRPCPRRSATVALLVCAVALVIGVFVLASIVGVVPPSLRPWPPATRFETELTNETLSNTSGVNETFCICPTNGTGAAVASFASDESTAYPLTAANEVHGTTLSPSPPPSLAASLGLGGDVSECCCTFSDLENANAATVRPLLERIVQTPFFSHFEIDLCSSCRLWDDSPMCVLRDCSVCECNDPPDWARGMVDGDRAVATEAEDFIPGDDCEHVEDGIVTKLDPRVSDGWPHSYSFPEQERRMVTAVDSGNVDDDTAAVVVDLRLNPERYTGYGGRSASKVWSAIHSTNCFQPPPVEEGGAGGTNTTNRDDEQQERDPAYCLLPDEQRLYNRVISGMHSSISLHIANSYCEEVDPNTPWECLRWGRKATIAHDRVLDHDDRVENLYVAFAVLLRAVVMAGPAVTAAVPPGDSLYAEGLEEWRDELLPALVDMARRCPRAFDESRLLVEGGCGGDGDGSRGSVEERRSELMRRFGHLREIMRCVGCDRCKLWGTLQTLGVGTALRVLLGEGGEGGGSNGDMPTLSRQEAVALVNTLERFSAALVYAQELRRDVAR